jgi:hypothetical protein
MATGRQMSEHAWIKCQNPGTMLAFLGKQLSERKRRLFGCACCRKVQHLLDEPTWNVLLVAERYADGTATADELDGVTHAISEEGWASRAVIRCVQTDPKYLGQCDLAWIDATVALGMTTREADEITEWFDLWEQDGITDEIAEHFAEFSGVDFVALLREIVGNPFRRAKPDKQWLTSDVLALARGIYDERAFDRMPILADALQDAGCNDHEILSHCRNPDREHARGCWLIDRILGKS